MNTQLYDILYDHDLPVIRAWAADPGNRSAVITVGVAPNVRYQLTVYDQPYDEPSIPRAENTLGPMIRACSWPE
jgi:hypothetical protein